MNNEMKFIEMRGVQLMHLLGPDEIKPEELREAGLTDKCLVRVNHTSKDATRSVRLSETGIPGLTPFRLPAGR